MRTRLSKPSSCRGCPLEFIGTGFSEPEGSGASGLMLMGEALGHHEAIDGLPFRPHAEAGSLLNRALGMAGQRREQHVTFNVCACQPPKNELVGMPWEYAAIRHCEVHWRRVVEQYRPKAILALGAVALRTLTGLSGDRQNLEYLRGYSLDSVLPLNTWDQPVDTDISIPVIGTYHPSHVKHGKWPLLPVIVKDIRFALDVAQHGPPDFHSLNYYVDGHEGHLEAMRDELKANPDIPLSTDVETNYSELVERSEFETPEVLNYTGQMRQQVTQVNLSACEGMALVVDASPSKMSLVREIHALPNVKVGHNILMFDKPVCEDNGIPIMGELQDTMWRFHHLFPDLPGSSGRMGGTGDDYSKAGSVANLQYVANFAGFPVPWKHKSGSDPGWYGCADADASLRAYWWTQDELEKFGLVDGYRRMVMELMPILERMCRRGIPVNADMLRQLHLELVEKVKAIDRDIQPYIPKEILPFHPKTGWTKPPADVAADKLIELEVDREAEVKNCCFRKRKPGKNPKLYVKYAASSHARLDPADGLLVAPNPDCPKCGGEGVIRLPKRVERRWAQEMPFNAASSQQMFAYAHHKGYKVPKNSKRKVAMDAEVVAKLAKTYSDPVFTLCDNKRGFVKLDSTYCQGWMPGTDGRVHSQIGPYPATGQLSGRNPNPQNVPALTKIDPVKNADKLRFSTKFRQALHAEPGYTIVECVTPDTKILTSDFRWVSAGSIKTGDDLIGFDEFPTNSVTKVDGGKRTGRKLRPSKVIRSRRIEKFCYLVSTDRGDIKCSLDHSFVIRGSERSFQKRGWIQAKDLKIGMKLAFLTKPWECLDSDPKAAYIAGFMDGEGYISGRSSIGFGQNDGPLADYVRSEIESFGYNTKKSLDTTGASHYREPSGSCHSYSIRNPQPYCAYRFAGQLRPRRLLRNLQSKIDGTATWGKNSKCAVVLSITPIGYKEVVAVETTTHTYISEGLLSHNCDWKSFHVQTLGYEAGDPVYIGLGKTDIHSFFAVCGLLKVETRDALLKPAWANLSRGKADPELGKKLKWYRKNYKLKNGADFDMLRNKQAKVAILAYGLGQQYGSLYRGNEDSFSSPDEARRLIESMNVTFPKEAEYRETMPLTVRPNGYKLINRYGFMRWFFGVQKLNRAKGIWEHWDDWEAAIAFNVQASAHGHLRECTKMCEYGASSPDHYRQLTEGLNQCELEELAMLGFNERFGFDNTVHDSLRFHCRNNLVEELIHSVKPVMEHPSEVMTMPWDEGRGLSVEVETKIGKDWGPDMHEFSL